MTQVPEAIPQLQMIYPTDQGSPSPEPQVSNGYLLRQLTKADDRSYLSLMVKAGFADWEGNQSRLDELKTFVIPEGFFVVEHSSTGALVATCVALHNPDDLHPNGGEVGWVAADPAHAGRGLGRAVVGAAVLRFRLAGYQRIYLKTDDHRLAAIAVYLRLGFVPFHYQPTMADRWAKVLLNLQR